MKEWSIKKAIRIQTYSTYDPIPVPFNLISSLLLGLRSMWRCLCCCLDRKNGNVSNELDLNELSTLVKGHNCKLRKQTFLKKGSLNKNAADTQIPLANLSAGAREADLKGLSHG